MTRFTSRLSLPVRAGAFGLVWSLGESEKSSAVSISIELNSTGKRRLLHLSPLQYESISADSRLAFTAFQRIFQLF